MAYGRRSSGTASARLRFPRDTAAPCELCDPRRKRSRRRGTPAAPALPSSRCASSRAPDLGHARRLACGDSRAGPATLPPQDARRRVPPVLGKNVQLESWQGLAALASVPRQAARHARAPRLGKPCATAAGTKGRSLAVLWRPLPIEISAALDDQGLLEVAPRWQQGRSRCHENVKSLTVCCAAGPRAALHGLRAVDVRARCLAAGPLATRATLVAATGLSGAHISFIRLSCPRHCGLRPYRVAR